MNCTLCDGGLIPWHDDNGNIVEYVRCGCENKSMDWLDIPLQAIMDTFNQVVIYEYGELALYTDDDGEEKYGLEEAYPRLKCVFANQDVLLGIAIGNDYISIETTQVAAALERAGWSHLYELWCQNQTVGLFEDGGWVLPFLDESQSVFVRLSPKNRRVYQWNAFAWNAQGERISIKKGEILAIDVDDPVNLRGFLTERIGNNFNVVVMDA